MLHKISLNSWYVLCTKTSLKAHSHRTKVETKAKIVSHFCRLLFVTGRNKVVAKVIFLHLSVILFTGGVSASVHAGIPPPPRADTHPWDQTPPRHPPGPDPLRADTPQEQTPPSQKQTPPGADTPLPEADTPPKGSRLWHTVNEQPVCILLECILVPTFVWSEKALNWKEWTNVTRVHQVFECPYWLIVHFLCITDNQFYMECLAMTNSLSNKFRYIDIL